MKSLLNATIVLTLALACTAPAVAAAAKPAGKPTAKPTKAQTTEDDFLKLAEAYQGGYLQLLAASAAQVYSTAGIVGTAFSKGQLDGPTAADQLSDTQVLHSVCYSTLLDIQQATPKDDAASSAQIGQLAAVFVAENQLLLALGDVFSNPSDTNAKRVETARAGVQKALHDVLGLE